MAVMAPSRPMVTVRPTPDELAELLGEHQTRIDELIAKRGDEAIGLVTQIGQTLAFTGEVPTKTGEDVLTPPMLPRPLPSSDKPALELRIAEARTELIKELGGMLAVCPTQTFYPPYMAATPSPAQRIQSQGYWYPVQTQEAHKQDGRIELGVIATHEHGEKRIGDYFLSDASGSVSISGIVSQSQLVGPTATITVGTYIDAYAQGWAFVGKSAFASLVLDLDVTVLEPTGSTYVSHAYSTQKIVFSKWVPGGTAFSEPIAGSHVLKTTFNVVSPHLSLFMATLSGRAYAFAQVAPEVTPGGMQCPLAVIDAEGYDTPKGDYYLDAGSIAVTGFSVSVCKS